MSYGWREEVAADTPSAQFRLGDAARSGTAADSIGGAAGTARGGITQGVAGLVQSDNDLAAQFNGVDSYITVADRTALDFLDTFTYEAWVNPTAYLDSARNFGCIMDKGSGSAILRFNDSNGYLLFRRNSVANICVSLMPVPLNQRSHVVVTKNGSTVKIYINGVDVTGTVTNSTLVNNALPFCIGAADGGADNFFQGTIDEVAVYTTALSARRVMAHYRAGLSRGVPLTNVRPIVWLDQIVTAAARTSITINKPAGVKIGDVIAVAVKINSSTVTPSCAGWTIPNNGRQVNTITGANHQLVFMWHRIAAGDPSSWTITWDGTSQTCEMCGRVLRGCAPSGDIVDVCAGSALTGSAGTLVPFALPNASGPGLTLTVWGSYNSNGWPSQPTYWHYGCGNESGTPAVGWFEKWQGGDGEVSYLQPFTGTRDAWTSLQIVIKDGGVQIPFVNPPIGLDGVNSPNDRENTGWPDGYTPALAIGANFIRTDFWPGMTQADMDAEFTDACARGMRILPLYWLKQQISTIDRTAFTTGLAAFVARYGRGGTFWTGRTDAYLAPGYVELFNEPWGTWYVTTVEPATYAEYFISSVTAGRAANPRCKYLIAGIDRYYDGRAWQSWFSTMFAAQPTLANFIDGVTVHLYGTHPSDLAWWGNYAEWPQIESIASDLYSRGLDIGGAVKFWITECGFNTASNTASPDYGVSQANQASIYMDALRLVFGRWSDMIGGVFFYRYRDGTTDNASGRWGICNNDGSDKPAKTALTTWLAQYLGTFIHQYGPDQWLPNTVNAYDGRSWNQVPGAVVAG